MSTINIKYSLAPDPRKADIAFVSVDSVGTPGRLNKWLLAQFGYFESVIPKFEQLRHGYAWLSPQQKGQIPIVFIVTVGKGNTEELLETNLTNAVSEFAPELNGKQIWVPLMGTGTGGLALGSAFQIISQVFEKQNDNIKFLDVNISIPDSENGRPFQEKLNSLLSGNAESHQKWISIFKGKFYAVGSTWGRKDKTIEFLDGGFWENGYDDEYFEDVKSISNGDILILKSTFQKGGQGQFRVKAIGIVEKNANDGKKLFVDWVFRTDNQDISGSFSSYRKTLHEIPQEEFLFVFNFVGLSDLDGKSLIQEHLRYLSNRDLNRSYWWLNTGPDTFAQNSFYTGSTYRSSARVPIQSIEEWDEQNKPRLNDFLVWFDVPSRMVKGALILDSEMKLEPGTLMLSFTVEVSRQMFNPKSLDEFKEAEIFKKAAIGYMKTQPQLIPKALYDFIRNLNDPHTQTLDASGRDGDFNNEDFDENDFDTGELDENENRSNTKERIPFHLDQVVNEDKLGREPVAKAFADLIKKDVFTEEMKNHSFIVHLQGEWGAGKSTFMKLIQKHLNSGKERWIFTEYNAWENQHLSPPWWTLIDQVYRKAKPQLDWYDQIDLFLCENYRRIIRYAGRQLLITLTLSIFLLASIFLFHNSIINFIQGLISSEKSIDWNAQLYFQLLISGGILVGTIHAFSKFLSTPLFLGSQSDAQSFLKRSSDPMSSLKKHFEGLVDDINNPYPAQKRQLVVFIDDIDRCHKKFIVELLEGIQTLFKEKRVLYIVAGQKDWIVKSFGNTYSEFAQKDKSEKLGELFLEKAFQLSIRVPRISESYMKTYWEHIIGAVPEQQKKLEELDESLKVEFLEEIRNTTEDIASPEYMESIQTKFNLDSDSVTNAVIEKMNDEKEELRHLLQDLHSFIKPNPRSIIRLANRYTMTRSTITAERQSISAEKIFRWLVIEDLVPSVKYEPLTTVEALDTFISEQKELDKSTIGNAHILLGDSENEFGGPLTIKEIKIITGK